MEIKLAVKILQVAMTIDEARQDGLAPGINDLSVGGNRDFAAPADCLEPACLDHDDGILDRAPGRCRRSVFHLARRVFFLPFFFSFFDEPLNFKLKMASQP